jgi:predicted alpha/beta hydrolase family esterase
MTEIVLIHGYAAGLEALPFKKTREDYEFTGFDKYLKNKLAVIFQWEIGQKLNHYQMVNPLTYRKLYMEEKAKAADPQTHQRLAEFLETHQPKKILAHSMGCYLILEYLKTHNFPESITSTIFVQADLPQNFEINNQTVQKKLQEKTFQWWNFYCQNDPTLILSSALNRYAPAGLWGALNSFVQNKNFDLNSKHRNNLHLDSLSNPKFVEEVMNI